MQLTIHHETVYSYPRPVVSSVNEVWLRPMSDGGQRCVSFQLTTVPASQPRPYIRLFWQYCIPLRRSRAARSTHDSRGRRGRDA